MSEPITLRTQDGVHFLTAELDGTLYANRTEANAWEMWEVEPGPAPGLYYLRSCHGMYLSAYPPDFCDSQGLPHHTVKATASYPDIWEQWRVVSHGSGVAMQGYWGLWLSPQHGGGEHVLCDGPEPAAWEHLFPSDMGVFNLSGGGGGGTGAMRRLEGEVRVHGRSFADASGPRIVHGCSDFGALIKYHEDRDKYLRQLDVVAQHQQYTRLAWRLNGWKWTDSGLTVDPIRDPWYEDALRGVLQAHKDRGLKVNLSSFDQNNWSDAQMHEWFTRTAQIARDFGPELVWLSAVTNEMEGCWSPGETDENVAKAKALMEAWVSIYPWGVQALSDPKDRDKAGMKKLAWTCALIHDTRWEVPDCLRHTFNTMYENFPGCPVVQDEPTGPNGSPPHNEFTRLVYQPVEDHDELFAIYTMMVLSGQAATYFNDPALVSREPLDSTYGFAELPRLWRDLEIPEDVGQGELGAGHTGQGMMNVIDSHAARADGVTKGNYNLGVISGSWDGAPWAVKANRTGEWSTWYSDGKAWSGHLSHGQVIHTPRGFVPAVVRCIT